VDTCGNGGGNGQGRLETHLLKNLRDEPGEPCLWFHGTWWSRGALLELVCDCEKTLRDSGFSPGMRLALILRNGPLLPATALAVWRIGGAVVPVNPEVGEAALSTMLDHADLFGAILPEGNPSLAEALGRRGIPCVAAPLSGPLPPLEGRREGEPDPEETAVIFYTSGTTGGSKAVPLTHGNLRAVLTGCLERVEGLEPEEVFLNALPNFHALGLVVCCLLPLWANFAQAMLPSFLPVQNTVEAMRAARVSVIPTVPTMISFLLGAVARGYSPPVSLKMLISGGDRLPSRLEERARARLGVPILEGYGLTETSPVLSVAPGAKRCRTGTVGLPLPGLELQIRDDAGRILPPGREGVLWVRGPSVARSYWRNPELSAIRFREGWFDTQDVVRIDEEGYLTVVARKSDVIIVGGFTVYPREIEDVLLSCPQVREAAVVGIPRSVAGQAIKAYVVPLKGDPPNPRDLIAFCRARLPHYKVPRIVEFLPELPKSSIGEVLKRELRER
jgi:long-chain acyl-CoA synthetase